MIDYWCCYYANISDVMKSVRVDHILDNSGLALGPYFLGTSYVVVLEIIRLLGQVADLL